ncbi:MAG: PQQ-dependent sugar dehydrogenase [Armatimonadetes bacterium]|nr:PQQ-dependent sugar dehydrogenase [Armatimonadota bacterium]
MNFRLFKTIVRGVHTGVAVVSLGAFSMSCVQAQPPLSGPPPAANGWKVETVAQGAVRPWGMVWLPNGQMLVTSKDGTLHRVNGKIFDEIELVGMPQVFTGGQGGLFDIALHPRFAANKWVYLTLSTGTGRANRTTLVRGVYDGAKVKDIQTLFQVGIDKSGGQHFGSRLLWLPDGTLLMSIGDGGNPPLRIGGLLAREQAQNVASHQGSMLRLDENGKAAPNNPFARQPGALPELWSIGNRNIQGLTRDPQGRIWATEHGPRGGDELNIIEGGKNYGWPTVSLGGDYRTGEPVGLRTKAGMVDPILAWTPSPGASGLAFYTGDKFPQWRGNLFSGGLASRDVRRVVLDARGKAVKQERLPIGRRVRDVRQGPDGYLYLLTDEQDGELMRIVPQGVQ